MTAIRKIRFLQEAGFLLRFNTTCHPISLFPLLGTAQVEEQTGGQHGSGEDTQALFLPLRGTAGPFLAESA
jgi:hypothetical protein